MESVLVLIKPDGVVRALTGEIISRYERRGLRLVRFARYKRHADRVRAHYQEHEGKPFYQGLIDYMYSGPIVALHFKGKDAIAVARSLNGPTNPVGAAPGTIRGDFGYDLPKNTVHASDCEESAKREMKIWFGE